mmetsp:Transcript_1256/g.3737  ORF Transcript_1256/g.3737 Transcript_1256/m.3737 type:complete len:352 (+) Transcript_1256:1455-2510(+)
MMGGSQRCRCSMPLAASMAMFSRRGQSRAAACALLARPRRSTSVREPLEQYSVTMQAGSGHTPRYDITLGCRTLAIMPASFWRACRMGSGEPALGQGSRGRSSSWWSPVCRCSTFTATVVSLQRAMYTRPKLPSPICFKKVSSWYVIGHSSAEVEVQRVAGGSSAMWASSSSLVTSLGPRASSPRGPSPPSATCCSGDMKLLPSAPPGPMPRGVSHPEGVVRMPLLEERMNTPAGSSSCALAPVPLVLMALWYASSWSVPPWDPPSPPPVPMEVPPCKSRRLASDPRCMAAASGIMPLPSAWACACTALLPLLPLLWVRAPLPPPRSMLLGAPLTRNAAVPRDAPGESLWR